MNNWIKRVLMPAAQHATLRNHAASAPVRKRASYRPQLQTFEDRTAPAVLTFTQGVEITLDGGGTGQTYLGAQDVQIDESAPNLNLEGAPELNVDADLFNVNNETAVQVQVLTQFLDIFGTESYQVPLGSNITAAILTLNVVGPGNVVEMSQLLGPWSSASLTWNSVTFNGNNEGGIQTATMPNADGFDARMPFTTLSGNSGLIAIDISDLVQSWANGTPNHGIGFTPTGSNGVDWSSSEATDPTIRPTLEVTFEPPTGGNNAPSAFSDAFTANEDFGASGIDLLANDSDLNGDPITLVAIDGQDIASGGSVTIASGAIVTLNSDNTIDYDTNSQFDALGLFGPGQDSFTYTISDGMDDDTTTVSVTIEPVNDLPQAMDTNLSVEATAPNGTVVGTVLAEDAEPGPLNSVIVSGNEDGVFRLDQTSGELSVADNTNLVNGPFRLEVAVSDGIGDLVIEQNFNRVGTVSDGNPTPTGDSLPDGGELTNNGSFSADPLNGLGYRTIWNDTRGNGMGPVIPGEADGRDFIGANSFGGGNTADVNPQGIPYQAFTEYNYELQDGDGRLDIVFDPVDLTSSTSRAFSFYYWINDTIYEDLDRLSATISDGTNTLTIFDLGPSGLNANTSVDNGDPEEWNFFQFNLEPLIASGFDASSLQATISFDGDVVEETVNLDNIRFVENVPESIATVTVESAAGVPTAVDDMITTDEDTVATGFDLLENDFDPDEDPLSITEIDGQAVTAGDTVILSSGAEVTLNADGTIDYDPIAVFQSLRDGQTASDDFTYTITDGSSTAQANVAVTIVGINDLPTVADVTFTVAEDAENGTVVGTVEASDPEDDPLLFRIIEGNDAGVFAMDSRSGVITVADNSNLVAGTVTLTVDVSDGLGTIVGEQLLDLGGADSPVNPTPTEDSLPNGGKLTNFGSFNDNSAFGLLFDTFWFDTRGVGMGPVLNDGDDTQDFIGETSFGGGNSPGVNPDGIPVQAFQQYTYEFQDGDGRLDVVFESVDLSGATNRVFSLAYWINVTTYEDQDAFTVQLSDGNTTVTLLDFGPDELNANQSEDNGSADEWFLLITDLEPLITDGLDPSNLMLTIRADTDVVEESIFFDNLRFSEGVLGTQASVTINVGDTPDSLQVASTTPFNSGIEFSFTQPIDLSGLNLVEDGALGSPDLVLTSPEGGVAGTLVPNTDGTGFTFVATGGPLVAGDYTLTLISGPDAFVGTDGEALDGDFDGMPGGDYVETFTVAPISDVVVNLPDFARGAGQAVVVPNTGAGLPITLSDATGVTELSVEIAYNPAMLTITGAEVAEGLPADATVTVDTGAEGVAVVTFTSPSGLTGTDLSIINLTASVPNDTPLGGSQVLSLSNVSINGGAIEAVGDAAVHTAAYFGDVNNDGSISVADVTEALEVAAGQDTGFAPLPLVDPRLVSDIDGDASVTVGDVLLLLQAAAGQVVPQIPLIP